MSEPTISTILIIDDDAVFFRGEVVQAETTLWGETHFAGENDGF